MKIIEDLNEKNFICGVPSWQYVFNLNLRMIPILLITRKRKMDIF